MQWSGAMSFLKKKKKEKKRRQRQRHKQQQQQLPPQVEDPASLFPFCSWCGREDHRWRSCPDGPPADWCGRCEVDGHSWAGCPHNPDQEQLQTPSSAATPPLPTSPPSPPSQEIWDWLMHPEADLFHDLPIAINTLWRRDGGRWEKWEAEHHPASFAELALMVVNYLAVDMGDAPIFEWTGGAILRRRMCNRERPGLTIWHMRIAAGRGQQSPMIRLSVMAMTRRGDGLNVFE
ncbi:UNVERIFIED_CONTAM: hypothetical protein FKN15_036204 [Acipenser sinensis]